MTAMTDTVRRYLSALASGDLEGMAACCTATAVVVSPVYGTVPARSFFEQLHADTVSANVEIIAIYAADDRSGRVIAHFRYQWERRSGIKIDTNVLDLFEFAPDARIERLKIVLDVHADEEIIKDSDAGSPQPDQIIAARNGH